MQVPKYRKLLVFHRCQLQPLKLPVSFFSCCGATRLSSSTSPRVLDYLPATAPCLDLRLSVFNLLLRNYSPSAIGQSCLPQLSACQAERAITAHAARFYFAVASNCAGTSELRRYHAAITSSDNYFQDLYERVVLCRADRAQKVCCID